jgi:hypothetical protein
MPSSGDQCPPHRRGDHPTGSADVDRFRVGSEDDPVDDSLAGGLSCLFRCDDWPEFSRESEELLPSIQLVGYCL